MIAGVTDVPRQPADAVHRESFSWEVIAMAPMRKPTRLELPEFAGTLSLARAARQLGIKQRQLRELLGKGKLPFVQVRGKFRVPERALSEGH